MTPQEKANELYNKFRNEFPVMSRNIKGKQCALIAVEEIIKAYPFIPLRYMLETEALNKSIEYWNEVKSEIEKL